LLQSNWLPKLSEKDLSLMQSISETCSGHSLPLSRLSDKTIDCRKLRTPPKTVVKTVRSWIQRLRRKRTAAKQASHLAPAPSSEHDTIRRSILVLMCDPELLNSSRDSNELSMMLQALIDLGCTPTLALPAGTSPKGINKFHNIREIPMIRRDFNALRKSASAYDLLLFCCTRPDNDLLQSFQAHAPDALIAVSLHPEDHACKDNAPVNADGIIVHSLSHKPELNDNKGTVVHAQFTLPSAKQTPAARFTSDILFAGNMMQLGALACLRYFIREVWPLVSGLLGTARLILPPCHLSDTRELEHTIGSQRILMLERSADVLERLEICGAVAAVLPPDDLMKQQLCRATAYSIPCVTTTTISTVLFQDYEKAFHTADYAKPFAEMLVSLVKQANTQRSLFPHTIPSCQQLQYAIAGNALEHFLKTLFSDHP